MMKLTAAFLLGILGVAQVSAPEPLPPLISAQRPVVVFLGDSLTAGSHLPREKTYPAHLQRFWMEEGLPYRVVNAGINGDTSAGALRRTDALLQKNVGILVIEIGGNDGLRRKSLFQLRRNILAIITKAREKNVQVVLVDAKIPPSDWYSTRFNALCAKISRQMQVPLMPFILNNVYYQPELMADAIHANEWGHWVIARDILPWWNTEWLLQLPPEAEQRVKSAQP